MCRDCKRAKAEVGNLCWRCYYRTVAPIARVKQPKEEGK
jgi:hypothetical protein